MPKPNVKIVGLDKAIKEINKRILKMNTITPKTIKDICFDLLGKSKERAPIDKGDLRGSGFAEIDGTTGTTGFTEPYSLIQHERLDFKHPEGGEAKYLENPLKENTPRYIEKLKNSTKKAVK